MREPLRTLLKDPVAGVRAAVVSVAYWIPEAMEDVLALRKDPDAAVREAVVRWLGQFRMPPLDALLPMLGDEEPKVRAAAVCALQTCHSTRLLEPLLLLLEDDCPQVRAAAATVLGWLSQLSLWVPDLPAIGRAR